MEVYPCTWNEKAGKNLWTSKLWKLTCLAICAAGSKSSLFSVKILQEPLGTDTNTSWSAQAVEETVWLESSFFDTQFEPHICGTPPWFSDLITTVIIWNIGTDRSEQTVQTQINVYSVCYSVCIFWTQYCTVKSNYSICRTITMIIQGVPIFRIFTVRQFFVKPTYSEWDMVVTMFGACVSMHWCVCASVWISLGHIFYIYGWISK